ncbi:MAG: HAD family hydrolase [Parachlamydiaceae bacterium]
MDWIHNYQLFLFDFDGLLVNTEELHYQAYQQMCANRHITLPWDFQRYCQAAHYDSDGLRVQMYDACPELGEQEPDWRVLYKEKQAIMQELLKSGKVALMPGAEPLLLALQKHDINRAVVTHSPSSLINILKEKLPALQTIPHWITRECYTHPKPHPDCYLEAIRLLAQPNDRVIGFEDTPRGMIALLGSDAQPILVCQTEYPEIESFLAKGVLRFQSLLELSANKATNKKS